MLRDDPASKAACAQHQQWRRKEARDEWEQSKRNVPLALLSELLKRGPEFFRFKGIHRRRFQKKFPMVDTEELPGRSIIEQRFLLHEQGITGKSLQSCIVEPAWRPKTFTMFFDSDTPKRYDYTKKKWLRVRKPERVVMVHGALDIVPASELVAHYLPRNKERKIQLNP